MSTRRPPPRYRIEPMRIEDLDAVMAIETRVNAAPWPASAYQHELEQNALSHYYVLCPTTTRAGPRRWWQWLPARRRTPPHERAILGYGGFWMMMDEAHISTIAVAPAERGRGYGELLLISLIEAALTLGAILVTLEVRVSNSPAQKLYEKYRMDYVGLRKRYYRNNHEDAHIMTVEQIQSPEYRAFLDSQWSRLHARLRERDTPSPRRQE